MLSHGGLIGAAGASAGSTLLVGDNTTPSGFDAIDGNYFFFNWNHWTASASGTPATIYVYLGSNLTASHIVAAIYDSDNALVAQSSAISITASAWNACPITGTPGSITSGSTYRVGYVPDGNINTGRRTTTWRSGKLASTYPAVPANLSSSISNEAPPEPAIYVMS